jgi:selenocysteine lyase/cysteine desulfurase
MYKRLYHRFLQANPDIQHYSPHSHHYWPDVTREAMLQYWDDSARLTDKKWDYWFNEKIPAAQQHIAQTLSLSDPSQIVFAPNTHELVYRILSCFQERDEVRVLTTDSEFHSFERQITRLSESAKYQVDRVASEEFATFADRFVRQIESHNYDLIFLSQVFYNSGVPVQNLQRIVNSVSNPETIIVVDGYHGFMALPTDLSTIERRVFYVAGSYKYAQAGEGCCFMHVPPGCTLRPVYTGWFAGFGELVERKGQVNYAADGLRFAGATMDFSALYRLLAVFELLEKEGLGVDAIHAYVQGLQANFRTHLDELQHPVLKQNNIVKLDFAHHGHFYAIETHSCQLARELHDELRAHKIYTDYRGTRLRFGFGMYQDQCIRLPYTAAVESSK